MAVFIIIIGAIISIAVLGPMRHKFKRGETFAELAIKLGKYKLTSAQKELIQDFIPYYEGLNQNQQKRFDQRLAYFIKIKDFSGADGIEPTLEMKTLIGAIAIKLTFGFKEFMLPHFHTIFIYPEEYYSAHTGYQHKGEVDMRGHIKLSWNNFSEGIANSTDGLSLAVHEFAHAVYFENQIPNRHYHFISPLRLRTWKKLAENEMEIMNQNPDHYIRKYGATNLSEFFAVTTELFFEQPYQLRENHTELYKQMVHIYKQDPRRFLKTHS